MKCLQCTEINTLVFWKRDFWLFSLSDDENIWEPRCEVLFAFIFNVDYVKTSKMSLTMGDNADSAYIVSPS